MTSRTISIFGATGSIGTSTLDLIERAPDAFAVEAVTAHRDVAGLAAIAKRTRARHAVIGDTTLYAELADALAGTGTSVGAGPDALVEAARRGADYTMAAIVGTAGLAPVMAAIEGGRIVALANKEALVSAGALMMHAAQRRGTTILPVDSEHNAIFQCLAGNRRHDVERVTLTASGGPFRDAPAAMLASVTPEQAVAHPNWSMGAKISVDSATLMNKGLELIEARWLFDLAPAQLDVLVHPQSVVHSLVAYVDGSVLAQLGCADMRIPIASTLAWPDRMTTPSPRLDLAAIGRLDFLPPDTVAFPALRLAQDALAACGARPAILNAANEVAVAAFLDRKLGFTGIPAKVEAVLDRYDPPPPATIDDVLAIDADARAYAREQVAA